MWDWTLIYDYLKDTPYDVVASYSPYTDYQILQGFFLANYGPAAQFLFDDPSDNTVGPRVWTPKTYFPSGATIIDPSGHRADDAAKWLYGGHAASLERFRRDNLGYRPAMAGRRPY